MVAYDFEYDGITLGGLGYTVCTFNGSGGSETIANGSLLTFNTVSMDYGKRNDKVSSRYDEMLTTTLGIVKNGCNTSRNDVYISKDELRYLMKWLNRREYHKLTFIDDTGEYMDVHYEATFNVSRVEIAGKIVGLELTVLTNRPFAIGDKVENVYTGSEANWTFYHDDLSDELGYLYPHVEFIAAASGNLTIVNQKENRTTKINNVTNGEIITMDYPIISSSVTSHIIQNDFNWNFFRLSEDFESTLNEINVSLPGTFKISYTPIVKVGI